jgi:hypothetical protein
MPLIINCEPLGARIFVPLVVQLPDPPDTGVGVGVGVVVGIGVGVKIGVGVGVGAVFPPGSVPQTS